VKLAVRAAAADPSAVLEGVRGALESLDPDVSVRKLQTAGNAIARASYQDGVLASVLSALALLGLGLASLGVYGVIARTVAQRTAEFGIRLALGAQGRDIVRMVLGSGARLALVGSALGLVGALAVTRLLRAAYPSMRTDSAPVLAGVTVLLIAIAQAACYLPARRAAKVNPAETLRAE
jgi:ABC-type antimicrobial peptide transport system permease subunit